MFQKLFTPNQDLIFTGQNKLYLFRINKYEKKSRSVKCRVNIKTQQSIIFL